MLLGILVLLTALAISGVAIYYSVAGLVAIFAAAAIPIMIMGGILEVGKLVTAVWLHKYWKKATWWLKTYLTTAVVILMFITSMGIFGFLSKAHIEQTSASQESVAQVTQIDKEIARLQGIIARSEERIENIQNSGTGADQNIQAQIDRENERIDTAYDRVQPAIDATTEKLTQDSKFYNDRIEDVNRNLEQLATMSAINTRDREAVKLLQQLVGARPDGSYGSGTAKAVREYKEGLEQEKESLYADLKKLQDSANEEIRRLRSRAEKEIDDSNTLITRLRNQLGTDTGQDIETEIEEQTVRIKEANNELDSLTEEKYAIQAEYRKLEAEVGPIKYIAEFVYGEAADKDMLEEAVRWVIIIIIAVFDPLAVLLLIASQYTFEWRRKDDNGERLRQYEQARAQRIVDNPGYNIDDPKEDTDENSKRETGEEESQDAEEFRDGEPEESVPSETGDDPALAEEEKQVDVGLDIRFSTADSARAGDSGRDTTEGMALARGGALDDYVQSYVATNDTNRDVVPEDDTAVADAVDNKLEQPEVQADEAHDQVEPKKKVKTTVSLEESQREAEYEAKEEQVEFQQGKALWKQEHPDQTLKRYKNLYIQGVIDTLPWERPQYTTVTEPEGYKQNAEQHESTIFNRIKRAEQDKDNN